mgnify:CR=1 FL=1|jgi:hypothetical protein
MAASNPVTSGGVLMETPGSGHRLLAHRLVVMGFDFVPGKGYWK